MAIVFFSGFETGDFGEWSGSTGTASVQAVTKKTGGFAAELASDDQVYVLTAAYRGTFYFQPSESPGSEDYFTLIRYKRTDTGYGYSLVLTTDRKIKVEGDSTSDTGDSVLPTDDFSRVSYAIDGSENIKVFLNGVEECSLTVDPKTSAIDPQIRLKGPNVTAYFDDVAVDNAASADDIGDIRVLRSSPNAAGQYAQFDTASGYELCDEVPTDGATTIVDDSGVSTIHRETYNIADFGGGGSDTIKAVNIWVHGYDSGNTAQGITCRDDGTDYETLAEWGKAYTWKNKLYDTNAPRASAWSVAIFNAFQAGCYSEGSKDVYVSTVMVMVAYTPVGVADVIAKINGVALASIAKVHGVAIASIAKVSGVPTS